MTAGSADKEVRTPISGWFYLAQWAEQDACDACSQPWMPSVPDTTMTGTCAAASFIRGGKLGPWRLVACLHRTQRLRLGLLLEAHGP